MNNKKWPILLLALALILTACDQANSTSSTAQTAAAELTHASASSTAAAQIPTSTATLPATATLLPTETLTPTATIAPFTETPFATPTSVISNISSCDNSEYVKDVTIPDGTSMGQSVTFKKTWNLKNSGTCAWTKQYSIVFISGFSMDGETTSINRYVAPGKSGNITIVLTSPDADGTYTGYWLLANASGQRFGQLITVQIIVSE